MRTHHGQAFIVYSRLFEWSPSRHRKGQMPRSRSMRSGSASNTNRARTSRRYPSQAVEHYHCAFPIERAIALAEKERIQINTTGGVNKSIRLPLRLSRTTRVVWFAELRDSPSVLRKLLNRVETLGKKAAYGYGRVSQWDVEETDVDASWFHSGVLMRALPIAAVCDDVQGKRRSFGAVAGPYWQASFFVDRYVPR